MDGWFRWNLGSLHIFRGEMSVSGSEGVFVSSEKNMYKRRWVCFNGNVTQRLLYSFVFYWSHGFLAGWFSGLSKSETILSTYLSYLSHIWSISLPRMINIYILYILYIYINSPSIASLKIHSEPTSIPPGFPSFLVSRAEVPCILTPPSAKARGIADGPDNRSVSWVGNDKDLDLLSWAPLMT